MFDIVIMIGGIRALLQIPEIVGMSLKHIDGFLKLQWYNIGQ